MTNEKAKKLACPIISTNELGVPCKTTECMMWEVWDGEVSGICQLANNRGGDILFAITEIQTWIRNNT